MMKIRPIFVATMLGAAPAHAGGIALNTQSAESLGAATAGAPAARATPGNAYFNPASIVGVDGVEGSLSVVGVVPNSSYDNASGVLLGTVPVQGATAGENVVGNGVFPTGAVAAQLSEQLFVGVALYAPFGFSSSFADSSVVRYHGVFSEVISASVTPILGVALGEDWAIAAGPRFQYINVSFGGVADAAGVAAAQSIPGFTPGTDDVPYELEADDFGLGYVFGVQGALARNIRVGAGFTSKIEHDFSGDATFDVAQSVAGQTLATIGLFQDSGISAPFTTPASVQFGAAVDISPALTLLASATLTRWSKFREISIVFDNPAQPPELITQNWRDAWSGAFGAEIDVSASSAVRFGVMIEESPVNDAFATPRIPDSDRVWASAGFSTNLSDRSTLHFGAAYVFMEDRPIDQSASLSENLFRGSLQADIALDTVVMSGGLDFRF